MKFSDNSIRRGLGKRQWRRSLLIFMSAVFVLALLILMIDAYVALGAKPSGQRLERISQSPRFVDGRFQNTLPAIADGLSLATLRDYVVGGSDYRKPAESLPVQVRAGLDKPTSELRITWLGHSTLIVELDGARILVDPVWGSRASPSRFIGTKRFYTPPLAIEALPPIDAVVISHDHYDHLDLPTVRALASKIGRWVVPLGIGSHLERWGIEPTLISEVDWWDEVKVGDIRLVSTPARHFSGRSLTDRDTTLWSGWAFIGAEQRAWFSGDTAMTPEFREIGERLGPFDVTMIETGAYHASWSDVHLGPEQALKAHAMVNGRLLVPVHWGLFDLALHGWTEPAERVRVAAMAGGVPVAFPLPGQSITPTAFPSERWWPELPWQNASEAPIVSTGVAEIVGAGALAQ